MNMKRFMNKKVVAIGLAAGLTLGAAGAAFAYFTSSGTGTGSATVGSSAGLNIAQVGSTSGIVPNGPAQTVNYTVTNNTSSAESVHQVTVTIATISGAGSLTGTDSLGNVYDTCSPSLFTVTQGSPLNANLQPGHSASGTATIALPDDGNNQDNCQGATLNLSFSSN
jgi:hypothetical protein